ncbi:MULTISPECIES: hypothetical protein [Arthrobacter]|uniref:hypothetical protein n=1 Tax=Arthrobacter TaxID=1663 RepID=UPI000785A5E4|nr:MULTISPECIES: hypothetical protein [Arthrobacter]
MSWLGNPSTNFLTAESPVGAGLAVEGEGEALELELLGVDADVDADVELVAGADAPEQPARRTTAARAVATGT